MCFISDTRTPRRTTRDVTVYKVMQYDRSETMFRLLPYRVELQSVVFRFVYKMGKLYKCGDFPRNLYDIANWKNTRRTARDTSGWTTGPGFYGWDSLAFACNECEANNSRSVFTDYVVVECVIPKGSLYYVSGEYESSTPCTIYCADRIRLKRYMAARKAEPGDRVFPRQWTPDGWRNAFGLPALLKERQSKKNKE